MAARVGIGVQGDMGRAAPAPARAVPMLAGVYCVTGDFFARAESIVSCFVRGEAVPSLLIGRCTQNR